MKGNWTVCLKPSSRSRSRGGGRLVMRRTLPIILFCAVPLLAQKYEGPRPAKTDLPYLVHADNLVPTESSDAKREDRKNEVVYVISGANSPVRTPLSSPVFVILAQEILPSHLQLYKLESKGGQREIVLTRKKKLVAHPIRLNVTKIDENFYRIEVDEILGNGEYSLTPEGSDQVFCFQIY
jgi:hypothetical protein